MTISQNLRIAQKNYLCKKSASGQFQYTLQIWPLLKKVKFLGPHLDMKYEIFIWNLTRIIFFSTVRIFYVDMTTSEGEGVCISEVTSLAMLCRNCINGYRNLGRWSHSNWFYIICTDSELIIIKNNNITYFLV